MDNVEKNRLLLQMFVENRCSPEQFKEFLNLLSKDSTNRILLEEIRARFEDNTPSETITEEQSNKIRNILMNKVTATPVMTIHRFNLKRWLIAATVVMVLGLTTYFLTENWHQYKTQGASSSIRTPKINNDVLPGGNKAVLILADGSTVDLDDANSDTLVKQGQATVIKTNGKLLYNVADPNQHEILYNTIFTPRGGQYKVILPDGTNVWLNAASSLYFPTSFTGNERRVKITGEAYFEVAKNALMPFIVSAGDAEVQVLGTHFNIMAYKDEPVVKTTLLEGSVKFVAANITNTLQPGQQSQFKQGKTRVVSGVDVNEVIAWKNGLFHFENADMETVMLQISRWYDVDVVFKTKRGFDLLHVDIPRSNKLSEVLKALELSGGATFKIEGKTIIVTQ